MPNRVELGKGQRRIKGKIKKIDAFFLDKIGLPNAFGVGVIAATSGSGKTILMQNIIVQQYLRWKIIFDFYDDYRNMNIPNYRQQKGIGTKLKKMVTIHMEKAGILLEDMNFADWVGTGMTVKATDTILRLIRVIKNWEIDDIKNLLDKIPDNPKDDIQAFNNEYGFNLITHLHKATKQALVSGFGSVSEFLLPQDYAEKGMIRLTTKLFNNLRMQRRDVRLRFTDIMVESVKMRTIVGVILRKLEPLLKYHPVLYIDESDKIFPHISEAETTRTPSSIINVANYVRKVARRNDVMMFFIIQDFATLHLSVIQNAHMFFLGAGVAGTSRIQNIIPKYILDQLAWLKWDVEKNKRQFLFYRKGGISSVFSPLDQLTIPRYPYWKSYQ